MEENLNHEDDPDLLALNEIITQMPKVITAKVHLAEIFNSIHKKMNKGLAYDDILDSVFKSLSLVIPCDRLGIALLEEEGRSIRFKWVRSMMGVNALRKDYVASMKDSSLQQVIYSDRPRIINDMKKYLAEHPNSESTKLAIQDQINSNLCCPIRINDLPCGVVFFSSRKSFAYENTHIKLFQEISEGLTLIIEHELMNKMILVTNLKEKIFRTTIHDLNNPLTVIRGTLDMIEKKNWFDHLGTDSKKYFNTLRRNSESMISLVNNLVHMNGLESELKNFKPTEVLLAHFMNDILADCRVMAEKKKIHVSLEFEDGLPVHAEFDSFKIQEAIENLVSNSIKYSDKETTIEIFVSYNSYEAKLFFEVTDQGFGIPSDELEKLFQEFGKTSVRLQTNEVSSGLGLFSVKRLIEAHGGEVYVTSKVGVGSKFGFWIPFRVGQ